MSEMVHGYLVTLAGDVRATTDHRARKYRPLSVVGRSNPIQTFASVY